MGGGPKGSLDDRRGQQQQKGEEMKQQLLMDRIENQTVGFSWCGWKMVMHSV